MARHNVRIARSGVQYYLRRELPALGLERVPMDMENLMVFGVYRPAHVLAQAAPRFLGIPVVDTHVHAGKINGDEPFVLGSVITSPTVSMCDGECALHAVIDVDDSRLPEYHEVSPGYDGTYKWQKGVAPNGEPFQIVCEEVYGVEHLALVPRARGGEHMKVLDHRTARHKIRSGLLWFVRKKVAKIVDGVTDVFGTLSAKIKDNINTMEQTELESVSEAMMNEATNLPDTEEKEKLIRFIADIPVLKGEGEETVKQAVELIEALYATLDTKAVNDVLGGNMGKAEEVLAGIKALIDSYFGATDVAGEAPNDNAPQESTEEQKPAETPEEEQKPAETPEEEQKPAETPEEEQKPAEEPKVTDGAPCPDCGKEPCECEKPEVQDSAPTAADTMHMGEEAITPAGTVVAQSAGQLRNEAEAVVKEQAAEVAKEVAENTATAVVAPVVETAAQVAEATVKEAIADATLTAAKAVEETIQRPLVADAMPEFTTTFGARGGTTDALDEWFSKAKMRR